MKVIDRRLTKGTQVPSLVRPMLLSALAVVGVVGGLVAALGPPPPLQEEVSVEVPAVRVPVPGQLIKGLGWVAMGEPLGEVWWTTGDCPPGVQVPCLDPTVSVYRIPKWAGGYAPNQF